MINKLGLGTVQFGMSYGISNKEGKTSVAEVQSIIEYLRKKGINIIDTAIGYGSSEEVLGNVGVNGFKVVTKFLPSSSGYSFKDQVSLSLQRLKVDHLYGLMAHRPIDLLDEPGIWEELQNYKYRNVVEKIGFSFNSPCEIDKVLGKGYFPDIVQVPYNFLDERFKPYIVDLRSKGCEIHTRSTFLQGLFFMDTDSLSTFFDDIKPIIKELQSCGNALPGLLLKYCLQKPFIDIVILGVNNLNQLTRNIENIMNPDNLSSYQFNINNEILTPSQWPKN